jgi:hypothetical protein
VVTKNRIDPDVAHQRAKLAARARWDRTKDRTAATQRMRDALRQQWIAELDPHGELDEATLNELLRQRMAQHIEMMNLRRKIKRAQREVAARKAATQVPEKVPENDGAA